MIKVLLDFFQKIVGYWGKAPRSYDFFTEDKIMPRTVPATAGIIQQRSKLYGGILVSTASITGVGFIEFNAYIMLTTAVNVIAQGYEYLNFLKNPLNNPSAISTIDIGYSAFKTGTEMASIALSPAIEIKKLAIVNIKSQLL